MRSLLGVASLPLLAATALVAARADAVPLALDLGLPRLALPALLTQAPPPLVVPPGTPIADPGPSADGLDHLKLQDGRLLTGKILTQVSGGFLFNDRASKATFVVPFDSIADLQQAHPPLPAPAVSPGPTGSVNGYTSPSERRFFLEAELRDLQGRYDTLSDWPGVETTIGGAAGIAVAVVILTFVGTDTLDLVFAAISGGLGAVSLGSGIWQLVAVENRRGNLQQQMTQVQEELGRLPRASLAPRGAGFSFSF